jgi:hypothetical protein
MELLERYLQAVKKHLPWLRQDDIIAELRVNLEAQLEDKEAELGRKLSNAEMEAWLKQLGSPLHVAARYRPQQYLIGPAVFPIYWFVLRLALGWCTVIYAIARTVDTVANGLGSDALVRAVAQLLWVLLISAAVVTLIFALLERSGAKIPDKFAQGTAMSNDWPQGAMSLCDVRLDGRKKPKTYAQAVVEVIVGWIALMWFLLVPHYPFLLMGPGAIYLKMAPYQLAPIWWTFYWCVVLLNAVELAWRMADLLRDRWQGPHHAQRLVKLAFGFVPLLVVLAVPGRMLFLLKDPADAAAHHAALDQMNLWTYRGFEVIAAITLLQLVWMVGRISLEAYRRRLATQ